MPGKAPKPLVAAISPGGRLKVRHTYPVAVSHQCRVNDGRTVDRGTRTGNPENKRDMIHSKLRSPFELGDVSCYFLGGATSPKQKHCDIAAEWSSV